jgi:hypothetical protein
VWSRTPELLNRGPGRAAPFIEAGFKATAVNLLAADGQLMGRVSNGFSSESISLRRMLPNQLEEGSQGWDQR